MLLVDIRDILVEYHFKFIYAPYILYYLVPKEN